MATENIENKIFAGENNISVEQVEEAVISALLLDAGAIVGTFPVLKPEMFSRPDLAFIYQAVSNLYDKGETVDMITVDTEMRKTDEKRWKEWGGIKRMASLVGRIRHISGLPYYVEEVKRQYMLRLLNILFVTLGAKAAFLHTVDRRGGAVVARTAWEMHGGQTARTYRVYGQRGASDAS